MVTFAGARAIVDAAERPRWTDRGTFVVLPSGYEDERAWLVIAGARECLIDGDPEYMIFDAAALLVDKRTGQLERLTYLMHLDRIGSMTRTDAPAPT